MSCWTKIIEGRSNITQQLSTVVEQVYTVASQDKNVVSLRMVVSQMTSVVCISPLANQQPLSHILSIRDTMESTISSGRRPHTQIHTYIYVCRRSSIHTQQSSNVSRIKERQLFCGQDATTSTQVQFLCILLVTCR